MRHDASGVILALCSVPLGLFAGGCATSTKFSGGDGAAGRTYRSAFLVLNSTDTDGVPEHLQHAMQDLGLNVTSGLEANRPRIVDVVVRYDDTWRWDLAMYLYEIELELYDGVTNSLLATGRWKNSVLHRFPDEERVVAEVVNGTFDRIGMRKAAPSSP